MTDKKDKFGEVVLWTWRWLVLGVLIFIFVAIKQLSEDRSWPERVTAINHNQYDVAVTDGGVVNLPEDM